MGRQEEWFKYAVAAKALGGAAWELRRLPFREREFWLHRGLLLASAEGEAFQISHPPK